MGQKGVAGAGAVPRTYARPIEIVMGANFLFDFHVSVRFGTIVLQKSPSGVCGIGICNNRIRRRALLNLCYTLERDLESIFRAGMLKIVLQQYRP